MLFIRYQAKVSKAGAFLQVYEASGFQPSEWKAKNPSQEQRTHDKMFNIFVAYKTTKEQQNFFEAFSVMNITIKKEY